jgi:asparagine synthase (glutamine-hydrolysing)
VCGIAGTYAWPDAAAVADRLIGALEHRGPDGHGAVGVQCAGIGVELRHRRLAILDPSEAGAQPMRRGGLTLVYNGELYNYPELRAELGAAGVAFVGHSDTEVLLEAWRRWGIECLPRLRGMFAFAVLDEATGELTLARDQLGIKPLFVHRGGAGLVFASELKGIVAALGPRLSMDAGAMVASLLYYWVPDTRCAIREVSKLQPGCWLRIAPDGRVAEGRYFSLREVAEAAAGAATPDLAAIVADSTRRHLISDVGVGAFLSGGLDSSYLTALAARENPDLTAFTIAFRAQDARMEAMPDDLRYAREVAGRFGVKLHEIEIAPDVREMLPLLVHHLDEPIGDPAAINTYLISRAAREAGITVLLSGMGADELFGGYRKHAANLMALRYRQVPGPLRGGMAAAVGRLPVAGSRRGYRSVRFAKRFLSFAELPEAQAFRRSYTLYDHCELLDLIDPDLAQVAADVLAEHDAIYADQALDDHVNRMCLADARLFLPGLNLTYTDRASMAASAEVRVPFVDVEVVKAAFALSGAEKIRGRRGKLALKQAAASVLPDSVVHRPKGLFSAPLRSWMSGALAPLVAEMVADGELVAAGFLRRDAVRRLIAQDASRSEDRAKHLWHLLTLEFWYRQAGAAGVSAGRTAGTSMVTAA